jgi:GTP-binding protein Era
MSQHCTIIALVGAPNAGKSTLLNALIGSKISIVSPKVQTTRTLINGIAMEGETQLVFIDTPGIFNPGKDRRLERAIVRAAWGGFSEADQVAVLVDAKQGLDDNTQLIIKRLKEREQQAVVILNKIDLVDKPKLFDLATQLHETGVFTEVFMISALKGDGIKDVSEALAVRAPERPWIYEEDQISTAPLRFLAAEVTREKLFYALDQELPYNLCVETEQWEETAGAVKIHQVIYVAREGQKKIIIGKGGDNIKRIGQRARAELTELIEKPVHLFLFVKVKSDWLDSPDMYKQMGLEF